MLLPWWTTSTGSALQWYPYIILYLGKCRVTDEFFRAIAILILLNSHFCASML